MAKIGFVVHPKRVEARRVFERAVVFLEALGHDAIEMDGQEEGGLDLIVSLGGDGTMLRAVEMVVRYGAPIFGVNLGNLGYLAEVQPPDMEQALDRFFRNEFEVDARMLIECAIVRKGAEPDESDPRFLALNEIVVERESSGHVIRVDVHLDGAPFLRYDADGLIVSTATGSTAYSLSARGPVLSPRLEAIVVTPITPHMLFDRALVLDPKTVVGLRIASGPNGSLMVDGQVAATLEPGDRAVCTRSIIHAKLIRFDHTDFHEVLKEKFGLRSKWSVDDWGPQGA